MRVGIPAPALGSPPRALGRSPSPMSMPPVPKKEEKQGPKKKKKAKKNHPPVTLKPNPALVLKGRQAPRIRVLCRLKRPRGGDDKGYCKGLYKGPILYAHIWEFPKIGDPNRVL